MSYRHRQFSDIRSNVSSRSRSLYSSGVSNRQNSISKYSKLNEHQDCVNCINKKLTKQKKQEQTTRKQVQIKEHLQNIKRINGMRDYQEQTRNKMINDATKYNKNLMESKRQSQKILKKLDDQYAKVENKKAEIKQMQKENQFNKTRRDLQTSYQSQLRNQLRQEKFKKQLQNSRVKTENPQQINRLKIIQQNDKYVQMMKQQRKKCNQEIKKQLNQKSLIRYEEKQRSIQLDKSHLQRVQSDFTNFSQFKPLQSNPYHTSRSILSSENNPEDIFTQLRRIQTQKTLQKVSQRQLNHTERMIQLKKQQQQSGQQMKKKLNSMRSYVQDLTQSLLQKRKKQEQQFRYQKFFQPQKSKTDYYTQELGKEVKPCNTCVKTLEIKYFKKN